MRPRLNNIGVNSWHSPDGTSIRFAIASLIVVPLIDAYGWRSIFLPAFVVLLVSPLVTLYSESSRFKNVKEQSVGDENGKGLSDSLFELLKNTKLIYLYVLPVAFLSFCNWWNDLFLVNLSCVTLRCDAISSGSIVGSSYAVAL